MSNSDHLEKKPYLNIQTVLISSALLTWIPFLGILATPYNIWGWVVKVLLAFWLLGVLNNYFFAPMYAVASIGPGIFFNLIAVTLIYYLVPHWYAGLPIIWIYINFGTIRHSLQNYYSDR